MFYLLYMKWNYIACKEAAESCNTRNEFRIKFYGAVKYSKKYGFYDDICHHMLVIREIWSLDKCINLSVRCKSKTEFLNKYPAAYSFAFKHNFLDKICSHMMVVRNRNGYWDYDTCKLEASKYLSKKEFKENSQSCYTIASNRGWIDDICSHMLSTGNRYNRCIYAWEFIDNTAYIGLTYNINERIRQHKKDRTSSVYKKLKCCDGICKQLTGYIDVELSKIEEANYVEKYRRDGWIILNKAKTGTVGSGIRKWTLERLQSEALLYNRKVDFKKGSPIAYDTAIKRKLINDICKHMQ